MTETSPLGTKCARTPEMDKMDLNVLQTFTESLDRLFDMGLIVVGPMFFGGFLIGLLLFWPTYHWTFKLVTHHRARKASKKDDQDKDNQDPL